MLDNVELEHMIAAYRNGISAGAREQYVEAVRRFVYHAQGDFSREVVMGYITYLQHEGYAPSTITKFHMSSVRRFFVLNGLRWPLRRGELPIVSEIDQFRPALHPDYVIAMIKACKDDSKGVPPRDVSIMCVASIYGLRRGEIANLKTVDINIKDRVLHVATLKHGRERNHLIPEQAVPWLDIKWPKYMSDASVSEIFKRIERAAGIPHTYDVGWHSIRRILDRLLQDAGVPKPAIDSFFRWKISTTDMGSRYYTATVIGPTGTRSMINKVDEDLDRRVFAAHPFLGEWA